MKAAFQALYWELFWKNRLVFSALGILLLVGGLSAWLVSNVSPVSPWLPQARHIGLMAFLISILISYTPFTLMENSGGWKMNSMVTRWFTLPVRTVYLVYLPLLTACAFIAGIVLLWVPVLGRIAGKLDVLYLVGILVSAQVFISTLSWTVPRKPLQFWVGVGLLFPFVLIFAIGPMDQPGNEHFRHALLIPLSLVALGLGSFNLLAACRNRAGIWPGELPLDGLRVLAFPRASSNTDYRFTSVTTAMLRYDAFPGIRIHLISWAALVLMIFLWGGLQMRSRLPQLAFSFRLLVMLSTGVLPVLGMVWMAGLALFAVGEPSGFFRSRLSSFRATLPVSSGVLAAHRLTVVFFGWAIVWIPLTLLSCFHSEQFLGIPVETTGEIQVVMARFSAVGAFVAVGALPFLLWGRCEGFPHFLLASLCFWACAWALVSLMGKGTLDEPDPSWAVICALLGVKFGLAIAGFAVGIRQGLITWRYPLFSFLIWAGISSCLIWVLPTWANAGKYASCCILMLIPFARLAWCPVAIGWNRHRA